MGIRLFGALVCILLAGSLAAQASANITGNVPDDERDWFLFSVNFTASASVDLDISIAATSGTAGLDVTLVDLDELAANGTTTAVVEGTDSGTGTINLTLTTATYSGVVDFGILIETLSTGTSPYSGTLSTTDTNVSAITANGTQTTSIANPTFTFDVLGRVLDSGVEHTSADTSSVDVTVDFGTMGQTMTFYVNAGGLGDGSVDVYEVDSGGMELLLGTLTGTGLWQDAGNFTTGNRTGNVTIRLKPSSPAAAFLGARGVFPSSVTLVSASGPGSGGGGGGGGDDGGCSTGGGQGWLMLLALAAALGVALRLPSAVCQIRVAPRPRRGAGVPARPGRYIRTSLWLRRGGGRRLRSDCSGLPSARASVSPA